MDNVKQFLNGIRVKNGFATDPLNAKVGDIYFNTTHQMLKVCISITPSIQWVNLNSEYSAVNGSIVRWDDSNKIYVKNDSISIVGALISSAPSSDPLTITSKTLNLTAPDTTSKIKSTYSEFNMGEIGSQTDVSDSTGIKHLIGVNAVSNMATVSALKGIEASVSSNGGSSVKVIGSETEAKSSVGTGTINELIGQRGIASAVSGSANGFIAGVEGVLDAQVDIPGTTSYSGAIVGTVADRDTNMPDAAVLAILSGGTARSVNKSGGAAFKAINRNTTPNVSFDYGLDLYHSRNSEFNAFKQSDIRLSNSAKIKNPAPNDLRLDYGVGEIKFPIVAGSANSTLVNDGSGNLEWKYMSGGLSKVKYHDPVSTSLSIGAVVIDGAAIIDGDTVLFSNLTVGSNKIYKATVVTGNVTVWTVQDVFNGTDTPADGDLVIVTHGQAFELQVGRFDGSKWLFNDKIRMFNGADYYEINALNSTLIQNAAAAEIFAINYAGSENLIIDYSISRGSAKEVGTLLVTTNGSVVNIGVFSSDLGAAGVEFYGNIFGSEIRLNYIADNSGSNGLLKFMLRRWSDSSGGPGGIPSYSAGGGGGGSISGTGAANQVAYWSNANTLAGNANFIVDLSSNYMKVGSMETDLLTDNTIPAGSFVDQVVFSIPSTYLFAVVDYSVERGAGNYRLGTLLITHDGGNVNVVDTYSEINDTQLILASPTVVHTINAGMIEVRATSLGGTVGTFKKTIRRWS